MEKHGLCRRHRCEERTMVEDTSVGGESLKD
jgi:hypothetical protein